jgi:hypothetical protein
MEVCLAAASQICQEGEGTSVTSTVLQQYIARHCTCTRYIFQFVLFHRTDVQCGYVSTTIFIRVLMHIVRPIPPGTLRYAQLI